MTSRERVKKALLCQKVDRAPWVPFVGCHGGALIGATAEEALRSEDKLVASIQAAVERYKPDGIPVCFDLQIEAESLGCELTWAKENPPSVSGHAFSLGKSLETMKIPTLKDGRIGMVINAAKRMRKAHPDLALYGLITGPFTLALHLLGTDIFMKMYDDPDYVKKLMAFASEVGQSMASRYIEAGCDIVAVVDPMTSQVGPEQFRQFVTQAMTPIFNHIREKGALGSFFVCGHAQQNIEAMCECRPDNVSVDENIPLGFVRDVCLPRGISFGGNLQLTSVLLLGSPQDAQKNAVACLEEGGEKGYVLAPGCDLPYATPPANLEAVAEVALDRYKREIAKNMTDTQKSEDLLDMSEYGKADKVIVDIITLDSEACAPCQYMVESVKAITPEFEGIVEWREHKIKQKESLVFMSSLMVRNIPTICIDGVITFVSRIPARDELIMAIQKRINVKLRMKIKSRKATLYILGDGGKKCLAAKKNATRAVKELGADVDVVMVTEEKTVHSYGFTMAQTPVIIMGRYQTKSTVVVPETNIMKEWLKDL